VTRVLTIGPYRFTAQDIERTVRNHPDMWQLYRDGRDPAAVDAIAPELTGDRDEDLRRIWAAMLAAGPALRAAGQLPPRTEGRVVQVSTSRGGVPKVSVDHLDVDLDGPRGDVQKSTQHHGSPWQALCIWSTEAIEELNSAGHLLAPGAAGENVTVTGLPWREVRAGVRLQLGTVVCEVSAFALPCKKNAQWFADGDFRAMHHERGPSRVYATVLVPGRVAGGDIATLEP
jgi:MOSC domain-containing protein YiiM